MIKRQDKVGINNWILTFCRADGKHIVFRFIIYVNMVNMRTLQTQLSVLYRNLPNIFRTIKD